MYTIELPNFVYINECCMMGLTKVLDLTGHKAVFEFYLLLRNCWYRGKIIHVWERHSRKDSITIQVGLIQSNGSICPRATDSCTKRPKRS
jgi:hypothetical protein